jgi:methanogenic corrinoid protein MtbC1
MLEASATGYAGVAVGLLIQRDPGLEQRYAPDAAHIWQAHLTQWVKDLAAALEMGLPALFSSRLLWSVEAYQSRGVPLDDLKNGLSCLTEVLTKELPSPLGRPVKAYLSLVEGALKGMEAPRAPGLTLDRPAAKLALRYLHSVLEGETRAATQLILDAVADGLEVKEAYLGVLMPAMREVGNLWHAGEISIAEEHLVTTTTLRTLSVLSQLSSASAPNGRVVILAAVAGNAHSVALHALGGLFRLSGWRDIVLGGDLPARELAAAADDFRADLIALSVTLISQLPPARDTIDLVRRHSQRPVKILVGGQAFDDAPEVWKRIGADGYAVSLAEAGAVAEQLVGPPIRGGK